MISVDMSGVSLALKALKGVSDVLASFPDDEWFVRFNTEGVHCTALSVQRSMTLPWEGEAPPVKCKLGLRFDNGVGYVTRFSLTEKRK
jgi:hypothetical protein